MATDGTIQLPDGRTVGFADFGNKGDAAVLWCHGGPGCRLGPSYVAPIAERDGIRLIGIDRPGYGLSTPRPGRSITDWVSDALAVADHLRLERFATIGLSTGGAYALAVAAMAAARVTATVACCAMTDMRYRPARDTMSRPHVLAVWESTDRNAAMAAAEASHGIDGTRIIGSVEGPPLPPSDQAMLQQSWGRHWMAALPDMFSHGVEGYTDDRLADGGGWTTFDAADITCPMVVLHGSADVIVDPIHARHTASIVPNAELRIVADAGHFSIEDHIVPTLVDLQRRTR